jgi:hypothetical protein
VDDVFLRYLDPAFRYVKSQNPALVRSRDDALRDGLNCVALAHLLIRDLFGCPLPAHLQAFELVRDHVYFDPVPDAGRLSAGDLVWLGLGDQRLRQEDFVPQYDGVELVNGGDFPVKHVAISTGTGDRDDPLLLHASVADGTNAIWPLARFADHPRYGRIYALRRLRPEHRRPPRPSAV